MTARARGYFLRVNILVMAVIAAVASAFLIPTAGAAEQRDPVIFVHGYTGSASNWNSMIADFESDGYPQSHLHAWSYNSYQSNTKTAEQFESYVDKVLAETGASKVDIVTHSMGGLNTRWYVKFLDGASKVDDWVSLAGPNHGTSTAYWCWYASCYDMRPGSTFLTTLNAGDETPGSVNYGTWWSSCDSVIQPQESTILDGAKNTKTACIGHSAFLSDSTVSQQVRDFVR